MLRATAVSATGGEIKRAARESLKKPPPHVPSAQHIKMLSCAYCQRTSGQSEHPRGRQRAARHTQPLLIPGAGVLSHKRTPTLGAQVYKCYLLVGSLEPHSLRRPWPGAACRRMTWHLACHVGAPRRKHSGGDPAVVCRRAYCVEPLPKPHWSRFQN